MGAVDALGTVAAVGTSMAIQAANPVGTAAQIAAASGKFQGQSQPIVIVNGKPQPATGDEKRAKTHPVKNQAAADKAAKAKDEGLGKLRGIFAFKAAGKQAAKKETKQDATETPASTDLKANAAPAAEKPTTEDPTAAKTTTDKAIETKRSEKESEPAKSDSAAEKTWPPCDGTFYQRDPALAHIDVIITYVDGVRSLVIDPSETRRVDWSQVRSQPAKEGETAATPKAFTLKCQLERKIRDFKPDAKGLASQLTTRILAESFAVVSELLAEAGKSKEVAVWKEPSNDSQQVSDWDARISRCSEAAASLKQCINATPGAIPGGVGSLFPEKTDAEVHAASNLKTNVIAETVKAATLKLNSSRETYKQTLDTYKDVKAKNLELQLELAKAKGEVDKLELRTLKEVLQSMIKPSQKLMS